MTLHLLIISHVGCCGLDFRKRSLVVVSVLMSLIEALIAQYSHNSAVRLKMSGEHNQHLHDFDSFGTSCEPLCWLETSARTDVWQIWQHERSTDLVVQNKQYKKHIKKQQL